MKMKLKFIPLVFLILILSACGSDVEATLTEGASIEDVYTAVAMTLAVQVSKPTSTVRVLPSSTSVMAPSPTTILNTPTLWSTSTTVVYSTASAYQHIYPRARGRSNNRYS